MNKIVECVPNISEGRDRDLIKKVCEAVAATGVRIVSLEPDMDYNRTVLTFVGDPQTVLDGAFACIKACFALIDMSRHRGGHPRLGACDVTPFVPVSNITLEDCADLAKILGAKVAAELDLPVYLYGAAAKQGKQDLAIVRKGQYEGLAKKLADPDWQPDFGPAKFNVAFGAALIGARPFLIAYNVNLASNDPDAADEIAKTVRSSGRVKDGLRIPGTLKGVKGLGVLLKERDIVQVSMNLVDYTQTNMHHAFEEVKKVAKKMNLTVTGSEIVGIVPLAALVDAGCYYCKEKVGASEAVEKAVRFLGLDDLAPFKVNKKVLEWILKTEPAGYPCGF